MNQMSNASFPSHDFSSGALPPDAEAALAELYAAYGDGAVSWMARLWDSSVGGFYYANSARDTEGFLTDVESTYQVLNFLVQARLIENPDRDLPPEMREKIISFTLGLQGEDGYFYHPQWGKRISLARRGRDLSWALQILNWFHTQPRFAPAPEQIKRAAMEGRTASLPLHLSSKENFLRYLASLDFSNHSHFSAHILSGQRSQIKAAGLEDVYCDFLDGIQNPDTGLWEARPDCDSLAGLYKIANAYNQFKRPLKHIGRMIDSAIAAILSEELPTVVVDAYNPFAALHSLMINMQNSNRLAPGSVDMNLLFRKTRENAGRLIRQAMKRILLFRQADGSFSYQRSGSSPFTQGAFVSLGLAEGDVNSTGIAIGGLSKKLCQILNINPPPLYTDAHRQRFLALVTDAKPSKKAPYTYCPAHAVFDGCAPGECPPYFQGLKNAVQRVEEDPTRKGHRVMAVRMEAGGGNRTVIVSEKNPAGASAYGCSLCLLPDPDLPEGTEFVLALGYFICGYQLVFRRQGDVWRIEDYAAVGEEVIKQDTGLSVKAGAWFSLSVTYFPGDAQTVRIETSLDGGVPFVSRNYCRSTKLAEEPPAETLDNLSFSSPQGYRLRLWIREVNPLTATMP